MIWGVDQSVQDSVAKYRGKEDGSFIFGSMRKL